jgi:hypothetical protein
LRLAFLLVALAAVATWQVTQIPQSLMQMAVGPMLAPSVVVGALAVLALLYGVSAWRGRQVDHRFDAGDEPLPGSVRRLLSLLGGGLLFMVLVLPVGFVLPATLCGIGVARAFDAPLGWRSVLVCGAIAAAFWLVFARLLGVGLGPAVNWPL